ncbi:MAG TPA: discoidin domain-containing protein [Longimicrobium sp.]|nr:discoidin domain-containing protein [Longimicrobium sp.]
MPNAQRSAEREASSPRAAAAFEAGRADEPCVADSFESLAPWSAAPSDGVSLALASDSGRSGRAMRMDVDFHGGGGYAVAHRALPLDFPPNYEISFWIRGTIPPNNLEFKLIDGDNVWWVNRRDFVYPSGWTRVVIRKRQISFAWGPLGGGELKHSAALEIAVTAGSGGRGSVWIDDLQFIARAPVGPYTLRTTFGVSSHLEGHPDSAAMDGDPRTGWHSEGDVDQGFAIDFQRARELGGFTVDWDSLDFAKDYTVFVSPGDDTWDSVYAVRGGDGGRDYVFLPETDARFIRLKLGASSRGRGYGIREVEVKPLAWSASRNDFFAAVARDAPRGSYPRYLLGEQSYWTITGVDGDSTEALVSENGMVETGKARFSLEPFLASDGRLVTWADARHTQSLERGYLPIPSVRREVGDLALTVTAFAAGERGSSMLWVRYRVENRGARPSKPTLYVALRPFQVNPSAQFLNGSGGAATVRDVAWDGHAVTVDGHRVVPLTRPAGFGAATFDQGNVVDALRRGTLPPSRAVHDPFGAASAALAYPLDLPAGSAREVWVAVPMEPGAPVPAAAQTPAAAKALGAARLAETARAWEAKLNRVSIDLPPSGRRIENSIRSNLAYILINRDGPAIQPGSRSYERSWIRDGSLTSAALLRLGHANDVRAFAEWYAGFQYASGKVPCCVDRRGADPVPENDSHGELLFLFAEYARHTGDRAFLERQWPHVRAAVAFIDSLRRSRMTTEYQAPARRAFYGLLPESISHEGYSAKPMHSYWDDFFALRGLKDAAWIAAELGKPEAVAYARMRDDFQRDLVASLRAAMAMHAIDYLPGSVELGDFDATSTTVGVAPGGVERELPHPALERTFEKYWGNFVARRDGRAAWDAYTPYELRTVGTMLRLGRKDRAHALLDWFLTGQRPAEWNAWAEVVWHDSLATKFIGDLPHTWVGSDFIRSVLDFFAYEREADGALVVGAGIPAAWVTEAPGVSVRGLSTHYGPLSFTMRASGSVVRVRFAPGLRAPPGGIILRSPLDRPIRTATVDGRRVEVSDGAEVRLRTPPSMVELRY